MRTLRDKWYGRAPFKPEDRGSVPHLPDDPHVLTGVRRAMGVPEGVTNLIVQREAERRCREYNAQWRHHLNDEDVAALIESGFTGRRLVGLPVFCEYADLLGRPKLAFAVALRTMRIDSPAGKVGSGNDVGGDRIEPRPAFKHRHVDVTRRGHTGRLLCVPPVLPFAGMRQWPQITTLYGPWADISGITPDTVPAFRRKGFGQLVLRHAGIAFHAVLLVMNHRSGDSLYSQRIYVRRCKVRQGN
jgi:hypothetical protein